MLRVVVLTETRQTKDPGGYELHAPSYCRRCESSRRRLDQLGPTRNAKSASGGSYGWYSLVGKGSHDVEEEVGQQSFGGGQKFLCVEHHCLAGQGLATGGGCNLQEVLATLETRAVASVGGRLEQDGEGCWKGPLVVVSALVLY